MGIRTPDLLHAMGNAEVQCPQIISAGDLFGSTPHESRLRMTVRINAMSGRHPAGQQTGRVCSDGCGAGVRGLIPGLGQDARDPLRPSALANDRPLAVAVATVACS